MKVKLLVGEFKNRVVEVRQCLNAKDFWINADIGLIRKADAILIKEGAEKIDTSINSVTNIGIKIPMYITAEIEATKK